MMHVGTVARLGLASTPVWLGLGAQAQDEQRSMRYTSRSREEAVAWQRELRFKLVALLKLDYLWPRKEELPLYPKLLKTEDRGAYAYRELEIQTSPGRRTRIVVTLPNAGQGPWPAVVCIAGHGGDRYVVYGTDNIYRSFARELAERGCVTISTNVGQHEVYEQGRTLMGERLWDLVRCVDYLQTLPAVDKRRIGCAGLSLGGEMTMWLAAMDERVAASVSCGFLTTMDQMEQNHCMCWKFDGLRELVDYADIYSLTAPRALMCQNGLKEGPTQFHVPIARRAMEEVMPIYRDFGCPEDAVLLVHDEGHVIDLEGLLTFLRRHLGVVAETSPRP